MRVEKLRVLEEKCRQLFVFVNKLTQSLNNTFHSVLGTVTVAASFIIAAATREENLQSFVNWFVFFFQ